MPTIVAIENIVGTDPMLFKFKIGPARFKLFSSERLPMKPRSQFDLANRAKVPRRLCRRYRTFDLECCSNGNYPSWLNQ